MYHYLGVAQSTKGVALTGWFIEAVDPTTGIVQNIFADETGNPIKIVSGVENRAKSDQFGNVDFFVASGSYDLNYYNSSGTYQKTERLVSMFTPEAVFEKLDSTDADKGASIVALAQGGTAQDGLRFLTPEMFYQATDGSDDALSLQRAIDAANAAGGGIVWLHKPLYTWLSAVAMKSGVSIRCSTGVRNNVNGAPSPCLTYYGSVGSEVPLTVAATVGDTALTFGSDPGFAQGDLLHVVAVRNALSKADAGEYWMSTGTASLPYAYNAEFHFVQGISGNTVTLSDAMILPGYNTTAGGEFTQRTTSAAKKVTPCADAHWIGGTFDRSTSGASLCEMRWALRCSFSPDRIMRGRVAGKSISITSSLQCSGGGNGLLHHVNDPTLVWDYATMHGDYNRFLVIGSQDCGFTGLRESFGGQSVDFSYSATTPYSNIRPYCENSHFVNCYEGLTSHPGCYRERWTGNKIVGCGDDALAVRGLEAFISANEFHGSYMATDGSGVATYGVVLSYGAPRRTTITGNVFRNFYGVVDFRDSSTTGRQWDECRVTISKNDVFNCYLGLNTSFSAAYGSNAKRYITYSANNHTNMGRHIVSLSRYSAGVTIKANTLDGAFTYSGVGGYVAFVYANQDCPDLAVEGSTWRRPKGSNAGKTVYLVTTGSISDTTKFPSSDWSARSYASGNEVDFADADGVLTQFSGSPYVQNRTGAIDSSIKADFASTAAGKGGELVGYLPPWTGAIARTSKGKHDDTVSAKDFGAKGDGVTDDTAALQKFLDYIALNRRRGYLPAGNYIHSGLSTYRTHGWSLCGEGPRASALICSTDNAPNLVIGSNTGGSGQLHSVELSNFSFDYVNSQPSTNTNANCLVLGNMAYECRLQSLHFLKGYYGIHEFDHDPEGQAWGQTWDDLWFETGLTGGAVNGSLVTTQGSPNKHWGRIYVKAPNMAGPAIFYGLKGYNWTIDAIEINGAYNIAIWDQQAGAEVTIKAFKVEGFRYNQAILNDVWFYAPNGALWIEQLSITGTSPDAQFNPPAAGYMFRGSTTDVRIGRISTYLAYTAPTNFYMSSVTGMFRVGFIVHNSTYSFPMFNNGSTTSADYAVYEYNAMRRLSGDIGDANYNVTTNGGANVIMAQTALTASRTIDLNPSGDFNYLYNGYTVTVISRGAVNGANTLVIKSNGNTKATITSDNYAVTLTWRRNPTAHNGWVVTMQGAA